MNNKTTICLKCGNMEFTNEQSREAINRNLKAAITDALLTGSRFGLEQARRIYREENYQVNKEQVEKESKLLIKELLLKHSI